jgi:hypothetical protein
MGYFYDGGNPPNKEKTITTSEGIEVGVPAEIPMSEEMTNRLWEVINENTELKQQLYFAEHRLEQIKRLLEE